jgi:5'-nucleotidase
MTNPMPPLILVTNDDGVHAPGIKALADALGERGEVYVVAPDREVSACAQSLTLKHPLRVEKVSERIFAVDGTPADCVNLAIVKVLPRRPELVVSGINRGPNLGEDVFYSGTVGGAREGSFFGVRRSRCRSSPARTRTTRPPRPSRPSVEAGAREGPARAHDPERQRPVRRPRPAPVITIQGPPPARGHGAGGSRSPARTYYWIEEGTDQWAKDDMSDIHAIRRNLISVTPLHNDTRTTRSWRRFGRGSRC